MRTRLYHARILTMKKEPEAFAGEVWIRDDKIESVIADSEQIDATQELFDQQIDCMGNLLLPGFKNCHAHGPMTFLRSFADDLPLQEWLQTKIFPAEARLQEQDIYILMKLAILEYIRGGITTSFEMYFHPEQIAKACIDMGFRVVLSGTVFGSEPSMVETAIQTLEKDYNSFHACHPLVDYRLGFHSEYSCCKELLAAIGELSKRYHAPVYMHNSETLREVEECQARYHTTPVALMESFGMFEYGGAGHHMLYTSKEDREIMKTRGLYVVTNPSSNLKLASGIAPVKEYMEQGIPVAIGTDGPASNNNLNFFKEMYLTTTLQKVKYQDAAAIAPADVLAMATTNGANLLGLQECNAIEAGKQADLILIDLLQPNMQPMNHMIDNLIYSGSNANVLMTMIAGRVLYANGTYHLPVDVLDIYEKANCIIRRIELEMN